MRTEFARRPLPALLAVLALAFALALMAAAPAAAGALVPGAALAPAADEQSAETQADEAQAGSKLGEIQAPTVVITRSTLHLMPGKAIRLRATATGTSESIVWSSSNKKVAWVEASGKVHALKKGKVTITARVAGVKATCRVVVSGNRWNYLLDRYLENSSVNQLVFVKHTKGSKARVSLYVKKNGAWVRKLECRALVGRNGMGKKREGDGKTPVGVYRFTMAFGIKADPGAKMEYTKLSKYDYWCGDKSWYNTFVDVRETKHSCTGEHLITFKKTYNYCLAISYNSSCTWKHGSAIFLHCDKPGKKHTAGCVAVPEASMRKILRTVTEQSRICLY